VRTRVNERRRWSRLSVPVPVFVRGSDEQGRDMLQFSSILNIGGGGALLASRKPFLERSRIFVEIPGLDGLEELGRVQRKFRARVLRINHSGNWYLYAAKFSPTFSPPTN
jgi:hypothetical protein